MVNLLKIVYLAVFYSVATTGALAAEVSAPAIMQAQKYSAGIAVAEYFVSEKLDGVRARWDGKQLISRNGNPFAAPAWFTRHFPEQVLDGELWLGRGQYQQTVSVVTRQQPHDGWCELKFMVFDLPNNAQPFFERYTQMKAISEQSLSPYLEVITQQRVVNYNQLMRLLDDVISRDGEGLMLHHKHGLYQQGRSAQLLKLKKFDDAEAILVAYKPGKGKYRGMVGSLKLRMDNGQEFFVGSGLTDELRAAPPAVGSVITFRYQGFTDSGLPRFPVYLRQRLVK